MATMNSVKSQNLSVLAGNILYLGGGANRPEGGHTVRVLMKASLVRMEAVGFPHPIPETWMECIFACLFLFCGIFKFYFYFMCTSALLTRFLCTTSMHMHACLMTAESRRRCRMP